MSESDFRIAVLASGDRTSGGGGSTADKFARDILEEKVALNLAVVICNNPPGTVGVYDRFETINKEFGLRGDDRIEVVNISSATHPGGPQERGQTLDESSAICRLLEKRGVGLVATLGYMKILTGEFIEEWGWRPEYGEGDPLHNGLYHPKARIINNHPGILPFTANTHGHGTHARAIELYKQGVISRTAMTYHLSGAEVDAGPVVYAEPVDIFASDDADSLSDSVQATEKEFTSLVVARHAILRSEHLRAAA